MEIQESIPHRPEADSFDIAASFNQIQQAVIRYKILILSICIFSILIVTLYIFIWPPIFTAEVMVAAGSDQDLQRDAFYQQWNIFRKDNVQDEALFITTKSILKKVILEMDLSYDEIYHPFLSYAVHLWGESWIGKNYRKIKYSIFPKKKGPYSPTEEEIKFGKILSDFKKGVEIKTVGESNIGLLIVKGSTPRVAEIANKIIDIYLESRIERFLDEAQKAYDSLFVETSKVKKGLLEIEEKITRINEENGLFLVFEKDRVEISQWMTLELSIVEIESNVANLELSLENVNRLLKTEQKEIPSSRVFQRNALNTKLDEYKIALIQTRQNFKPDSPEVKKLEKQITRTEELMEEQGERLLTQSILVRNDAYIFLETKRVQLETELSALKAKLAVKKKASAKMKKMLDSIPRKVQIHHKMERERAMLESKYSALNEKLMMAAVSKATLKSAPSSMRVAEYADPPEKPSWPKTKLTLIATVIFGLACGICAALILEIVFVRASRHKLEKIEEQPGSLYAIVEQDSGFIKRIFY